MQSAQNLMSSFEFIASLMSILIGHRDVFARHRANGSSWGTFPAGVVRSVCRAICASCWRRSHYQPTRLRSVLRVVPTGNNAGVGTSGEKVFGRKHDDDLTGLV